MDINHNIRQEYSIRLIEAVQTEMYFCVGTGKMLLTKVKVTKSKTALVHGSSDMLQNTF